MMLMGEFSIQQNLCKDEGLFLDVFSTDFI